jgi:hypothetical protein
MHCTLGFFHIGDYTRTAELPHFEEVGKETDECGKDEKF